MDVSQWGLGDIMQLPDCCFGRRWPIAVTLNLDTGARDYVISDTGLPEVGVIWAAWLTGGGLTFGTQSAVLRLGDELPATAAAFGLLEPLFRGIEGLAEVRSEIWGSAMGVGVVIPMRLPVASGGRRLVCELFNPGTQYSRVQAGIVVSGVPRGVPDCLVSV